MDNSYSSWLNWDPGEYLNTYFTSIGSDTTNNLQFLVRELSKFKKDSLKAVLDFGSGPTIFSAAAVAPYTKEIHMADYLPSNIFEIKKWITSNKNAFAWDEIINFTLSLEKKALTSEVFNKRVLDMKKKIKKLFLCDAHRKDSIFGFDFRYPLVITNFCAESATSSKETWKIYMSNIIDLVLPGGTILISALRNCKVYKSSHHRFPSANINEEDLNKLIINCGLTNISLEICKVPDCRSQGFTSIMFARAEKKVD